MWCRESKQGPLARPERTFAVYLPGSIALYPQGVKSGCYHYQHEFCGFQTGPFPVESLLLDVADVFATSLDLDTTLRRVAEVVRKVIDYEIFAILLLNEKTQEMRFRFQIGYPPEFAERTRVKVGEGVTGLAAQSREPVLIDDVREDSRYIEAVPNVCSELAIPLITKNRVIGVIDIEAREPRYFTEEHQRLLTLVASRMAAGIENAQLYTRTTKQARILLLLNEIARELTSILNLDELLGPHCRTGPPPDRLPDVQHSAARPVRSRSCSIASRCASTKTFI